jgi:hypothetical protein
MLLMHPVVQQVFVKLPQTVKIHPWEFLGTMRLEYSPVVINLCEDLICKRWALRRADSV